MYKFECFCTKFIRKEILKSLSTPSANDTGTQAYVMIRDWSQVSYLVFLDSSYKSWTQVNGQSFSRKSVSDVSVDTNNSFCGHWLVLVNSDQLVIFSSGLLMP